MALSSTLLATNPKGLSFPGQPVLFFDGTCVLCSRAVRLLAPALRKRKVLLAPLSGSTASAQLHTARELPDSIVLLNHGNLYVQSEAVLRTLALIGGVWCLASPIRLVPKFLRDHLYEWIARNRYRWFGRVDQCAISHDEFRDIMLP